MNNENEKQIEELKQGIYKELLTEFTEDETNKIWLDIAQLCFLISLNADDLREKLKNEVRRKQK